MAKTVTYHHMSVQCLTITIFMRFPDQIHLPCVMVNVAHGGHGCIVCCIFLCNWNTRRFR